MSITPYTMYWITRLSGISTVATLLTLLFGVILLFLFLFFVFGSISDDNSSKNFELKKSFKFLKIFSVIFAFLLSCSLLIPTTKEMAAIIVVPKIANSEKIQNIGEEFYNLALDWMKELHPNENKNKM